MAYLRPPLLVRRVFNPLAMALGLGGSITLVVAGRTTGTPRRLPVITVEVDGVRYLVSTRGESDWVRNLRAAGGRGEQRSKSSSGPFVATEIPVAARPDILRAYRRVAGKTVDAYFKKLPDPADHPVFRIDPA